MDRVDSVGTLASSNTLREFVNQALRKPDSGNTAVADDRVEISELASYLSKLAELPDARARKIVSVRNQIERGVYETPEKLDIATDRILEHL